jgi:hypothetical protein
MKYAVKMGSGAVIHIRSFIRTGSGIQKLVAGVFADRLQGDRINLL